MAERLERLRSALEAIGAPAWSPGPVREVPASVADRCRPGSQLAEWVGYVASIDLRWDARQKVAFGWSLLNVDEIADRLGLGIGYGRDLAYDGVDDAWGEDWVPVLGHNDGLVVVDGSDAVHRLWWETGDVPMGMDVAGLVDLLIALLEDGTYVWDTTHGAFDFGGAEGHPVLDAY